MSKGSAEINPLADVNAFQQAIISWFASSGKDYPWRRTTDPYAILVSEMMLQQTQVATVLGKRYFENWLEKFPTPSALAAAEESEILRAWEGLGYYNRARNLQKTARVVCGLPEGEFPQTTDGLLSLPGIGRYTAGAVATFAFDAAAPIIDANIARVLARVFNYRDLIDAEPGISKLWTWAAQLVPEKDARLYNSGLMELGQTICTPKAPECQNCPVAAQCAGRLHDPSALPAKKARRSTEFVVEHAALAIRNGTILLHTEPGRRRQGLWKLPERADSYFVRTLAPLIYSANYTITHHRVSLQIYDSPLLEAESDEKWFPLELLTTTPMPSPYRKALSILVKVSNF